MPGFTPDQLLTNLLTLILTTLPSYICWQRKFNNSYISLHLNQPVDDAEGAVEKIEIVRSE